MHRSSVLRLQPTPLLHALRTHSNKKSYQKFMGKKKSVAIPEEQLVLQNGSLFWTTLGAETSLSTSPPAIADTHTHLISTFSAYRSKYRDGQFLTVHDFVRGYYVPPTPTEYPKVKTLVDVYCEAPVVKTWKEVADSALTPEDRATKWGGVEYFFVIGVHPHEAKLYDDLVENDIIEAASHPRCVGMGEMGLDYHYDNSPREIQREVLARQLDLAVMLGKSLTIHTREADEDILPILKQHVPKDYRIHIHCFTDTPQLAKDLLDHFPNLFIGITGVVTFATNLNTRQVIHEMVQKAVADGVDDLKSSSVLRIVLETDAPFMVPGNLSVAELGMKAGTRLPFSHSGMIPWTAHFVAEVATAAAEGKATWTAEDVLRIGEANASHMYGVPTTV